MLLEVTPEELMVIQARRAEATRVETYHRRTQTILRNALAYDEWLRAHGAGSSYTTFCDEFGFDEGPYNRPAVFEAIEGIRLLAAAAA